jgi:hypothetical protein
MSNTEWNKSPHLDTSTRYQQNREILEHAAKFVTLATTGVVLLAVFFDVGYFSAIDINFFTLFSISEHMLFSLEALPYAVTFFTAALFGDSIVQGPVRPIERFAEAVSDLKKRKIYIKALVVVFASAYIFLIIYIGISMHWLIIVIIPLAALALIYRRFSYVSYVFRSAFFLVSSFAIGAAIANAYTRTDQEAFHKIYMKDASVVSGRVIRSGNNGLLYFDTAIGEIIFTKWEAIESIAKIGPSRLK